MNREDAKERKNKKLILVLKNKKKTLIYGSLSVLRAFAVNAFDFRITLTCAVKDLRISRSPVLTGHNQYYGGKCYVEEIDDEQRRVSGQGTH